MTGTVKFRDGNTTLGIVSLVSTSASFTTSSLSRGVHTITATYSGDSNYNTVTAASLPDCAVGRAGDKLFLLAFSVLGQARLSGISNRVS